MLGQSKKNSVQIDSIILDALQLRGDISSIEVLDSINGSCFSYVGGPRMLSSDVVFDNCSIDDKKILISYFLSEDFLLRDFNWELNVEMAKLSAKYGGLVRKHISQFVQGRLNVWESYFLQFACLGSDRRNESCLISLLDNSSEDFRDGLFIASWFMGSRAVDEFLAHKFKLWQDNQELECGTGEFQAMKMFCDKWDSLYGKDGFHAPLRELKNSERRRSGMAN